MIISELNYLETVNEEVVGAGGLDFNTNIKKNIYLQKKELLLAAKKVKADAYVSGNIAEGEAISDAIGKDGVAQTFTETQVVDGYFAGSYSQGLAATNGGSYCYYC